MSARHGTASGYNAHQNRGEQPCDACALAKREYDARRRSATPTVNRGRALAKAQSRALAVLKRNHLNEYHELYEAFRVEVLAELDEDER